MGRINNELTPLKVKALNKVGKYADGRGLYLQISKWGTKSWLYRYQLNGKRREMGLGSIGDYTLAEARKEVVSQRELLLKGIDPKVRRDAEKHESGERQTWTFNKCADAFIQAHAPSWSNAKHQSQWRNTLNTYASPVIGNLPVEDIDTAAVIRVIEPIWLTKNETASRVRARVEKVLSWSIARKYRDQPNPAIWHGNISELLPKRSLVRKEKHHAALPYTEIGVFFSSLKKKESISALALRFCILTGCRTNEVIQASWNEIDMEQGVWTIPPDRMKSKRQHRVPLSKETLQLLENLPTLNGWLFPSPQSGKHISNIAMLKLVKTQMARPDLTVHGFRSTFRDWCAEVSPFPRELAEAALAHVLNDKTEAAYQRGDLLDKRRELMQEWANYVHEVHKVHENVVSLKTTF